MNQELPHFFNPHLPARAFDSIRITVASPEQIKRWSSGEIRKPETINYRTFKPERDGLFCARIFGPVKDYECLCGKYKRIKYRGVTCEKCGVEVTLARVRRERMGHIELVSPVAHIWFLKSLPSRISLMLDMQLKDVERVLYFEAYIVTEPGLTDLHPKQLLTEQEYMEAQETHDEDSFTAMIGAEAIRELLGNIDLEEEAVNLRLELEEAGGEMKKVKLAKRIKLVDSFIHSGIRPEWMILSHIPVLPPDLRPLVPLEGGRFATSDLNDLYRRVINRNNRLKRLSELRAPDIIIRNEKRMLQESVDALFDNGRRGRVIAGTNKRALKSLSEILKGKQGRFRQNLLGKRVDYSGRSVIVVGPELKLHECGLPKKMALELFKPFIYARLDAKGLTGTVKAAKKMVEKEKPEVWDILEEVIREHPIMLNRAPTLHRLGIQAFEPKLIDGKAIQLHPLVCTAFNADFDGDQMAVHVPLSLEAQLEARVLMMSTNNILSPANGRPIIVPSQDIVLGLYSLSMRKEGEKGEGMIFSGMDEIDHAIEQGELSIHAAIKSRIEFIDNDGVRKTKIINTTPGQMRIVSCLPMARGLDPEIASNLITKKEISRLIDVVYRICGQKATVLFCDRVMGLGFREATLAGISFGKDDMVIPEVKRKMVDETRAQVSEYERQYADGLITRGEKYNKVIEAWSSCTDKVADAMMSATHGVGGRDDSDNSVSMMVESGARGSKNQMRQLAGMRGLMAKPSGEIIETPIVSNFKEGLTVLEYFNSTHGARKGLADTALKTANSGYLTRRLVDVAQDSIITEEDCGSDQGMSIRAVMEGAETIVSLGDRVLGRVSAAEILHPVSGETVLGVNAFIDEKVAASIDASGIDAVKVRSPLTCSAKNGLCAYCYGRDLARGAMVNIGEAVGVVAAQSIGEPGTQLTMRTFHVGGAAQVANESSVDAAYDGKVRFVDGEVIKNSDGEMVVVGRSMELQLIDTTDQIRQKHKMIYGARLRVRNGAKVTRGTRLADWDPFARPIIAEVSGKAVFEDIIDGVTMHDEVDEATGIASKVITDGRMSGGSGMKPRIMLTTDDGQEYPYRLPVNAILSVADGDEIKLGDVLARLRTGDAKTRDITGGLPRVAELFEARRPKDHAIMADFDGRIEFGREYKNKRLVKLIPEDELHESKEYSIPKGADFVLQEGDLLKKGDNLLDGHRAPQDILSILGMEALAEYLIHEVQTVYRMQGVPIDDKHIEVIIRQMLQKIEVTDSGGTRLIQSEHIDRSEFNAANRQARESGKAMAHGNPILLGITKASLQTRSFISAASFQETTRVLTEAAIQGKVDRLEGLKENVIVGRLIPAGTGGSLRRYRAMAEERDAALRKRDEIPAVPAVTWDSGDEPVTILAGK